MSKEAQKLIHLDLSLTDAQKWLSRNGTAVENTLSWDNKNNIYYRSIAFTNDGYILSHGKISNSSAVNLSGGADNKQQLVYQSAAGVTAYLDTPTINGQVLKYDTVNKKLYWATDIDTDSKYKLTINNATNGNAEGTLLGTIWAPTTSGTGIPSLSGSTWSYNTIVESITDSTNSGIPTVAAIKNYVIAGITDITTALNGAFQYIKDAEDDPTKPNSTIVAPEGGWKVGNVVGYNKKEFLYTSSGWREFGDEGSYLLKTKKPLSSPDGTISISNTTIDAGITLDLATINPTNIKGTNNIVNGITTDKYGRITAVSYATAALTDTWKANTATVEGYVAAPGANHTGYMVWGVGAASTNPSWQSLWLATTTVVGGIKIKNAKDSTAVTITNYNGGKTDVKLDSNGIAYVKVPNAKDLIGSTAIGASNKGIYWNGSSFVANAHTVDIDVPANAKFTDTNTWRPIYAYNLSNVQTEIRQTSTGTSAMYFGSEFAVLDIDSENALTDDTELHLVWAEVDASGNITYGI